MDVGGFGTVFGSNKYPFLQNYRSDIVLNQNRKDFQQEQSSFMQYYTNFQGSFSNQFEVHF